MIKYCCSDNLTKVADGMYACGLLGRHLLIDGIWSCGSMIPKICVLFLSGEVGALESHAVPPFRIRACLLPPSLIQE